MMIDCPICRLRVQVRRGVIVEHDEPTHVVPTGKKSTLKIHIRCTASDARVEERA